MWRDRIPRVAHLDPDALTVPAGPGVAVLADDLAAVTAAGPEGTLARLDLLGQVLASLVDAYRDRIARAHPLADAPTVRWLGFVLADEVAALTEVRALSDGRKAAVPVRHPQLETGVLLGLGGAPDQ